ncbi:MAG TPA: multiheme c-type cytochrome [Myxococcota bacterium]|nr:multiheme c-type cytochrome [Myxococcota bacterium]
MPSKLLAIAVLGALIACGDAAPGDAAAPAERDAAPAEPSQAAAPDSSPHRAAKPAEKRAIRPRNERPLPNFSGQTLDGKPLGVSSLLGKRLLIYFFNPEVPAAPDATRAVVAVSKFRGKHNFEILGVATGSSRETAQAFAQKHAIDFSVLDDSSAAIAQRIGLRQPMTILGVDADGYVTFGIQHFTTHAPDPEQAIEGQIREALRLPPLAAPTQPLLGSRPPAPPFAVDVLDSEERFELAAQRGKPVILIFFLHTCPHCHETLAFLRGALDEIPADKRPALIGIEITGRTEAVRRELKARKLDFFRVAFDDDHSIQNQYGVFAGVPDTFFIDAQGRIAARVKGWDAQRDAPLARMRIAKLSGAPVPMLLRKTGYSGSDACGVCHEMEQETWLFTQHAHAFDTLVKHGAAANAECIGCHVVGYSEPGGFASSAQTPELENVGCESCHGRGGPHLSPGVPAGGDYSVTCAACHTPEHSLGFEYASFHPKISHVANAHIAKLSLEEREALLESLGGIREVLPTGAEHVGSEACRACHASEYETWAASPHARAVATLAEAGKSGDADCLACHTTGFGRPGGFSKDLAADAQSDLARVGCESCHGPGADHVAPDAPKAGTIVSLGDKCDSCVILQICGSCHDDVNDPGFEFEVLEKIELQRHGTIEPAQGKPKHEGAQRLEPNRESAQQLDPLDVALASGAICSAFDRLGGGAATWNPR